MCSNVIGCGIVTSVQNISTSLSPAKGIVCNDLRSELLRQVSEGSWCRFRQQELQILSVQLMNVRKLCNEDSLMLGNFGRSYKARCREQM